MYKLTAKSGFVTAFPENLLASLFVSLSLFILSPPPPSPQQTHNKTPSFKSSLLDKRASGTDHSVAEVTKLLDHQISQYVQVTDNETLGTGQVYPADKSDQHSCARVALTIVFLTCCAHYYHSFLLVSCIRNSLAHVL